MTSGSLYIVGTPIGNLADISFRAVDTLRCVDRIAAEDTRHTRKLLSHYDIHKPLVSYHSQNMQKRGPQLLQNVQLGESLALVTDAGTPGISDPGSLLVRQALDMGIQVVNVPGPAALITALVISGLPTQPFCFLGFPPSRGAGRTRFFQLYSTLPMTVIIYESPQRLHRTLSNLLQFWGNRQVAVARELTKKYEEVYRGTIDGAQDYFPEKVRGEITVVIAGAEQEAGDVDEEQQWHGELADLIDNRRLTVKAATDEVAAKYAISRRTVYQEALRLKRGEENPH